ncbi:MAG: cytidine deaminase [Kofleriaceae bacterium]
MARLEAAARAAQRRAYAPYSGFPVGAAVSAGGRIFAGANVENASYGLTVCAERNAIAAAVNAGHRTIDAVAVITTASPPASPCGMCRQVMREFAPDPAAVPVVAFNGDGARRVFTVAELLPGSFAGDELPPPPRARTAAPRRRR